MGFQLGPSFLRRPPRGSIAAVAYAVRHRVYDPGQSDPEGGESVFDTSYVLDATWRVEVPGREPYEVVEENRTVPVWTMGGPLGAGKRWYKVRIRPTGGLHSEAPIPVHVDPSDPEKLWIDWDAAHDAHVPLWERDARVKRAIAERESRYDGLVERVINPFAGKLREGEQELVDAKVTAQAARDARIAAEGEARAQELYGFAPADPDEAARQKAWSDELVEIHRTGRKLRATVVSKRETGETVCNVPVIEVAFDVREHSGATRRVVYENLSGPRAVKRYTPGKEVDVWIAPGNPDRLCPGK